jgi:uncharacterized membrane protein
MEVEQVQEMDRMERFRYMVVHRIVGTMMAKIILVYAAAQVAIVARIRI